MEWLCIVMLDVKKRLSRKEDLALFSPLERNRIEKDGTLAEFHFRTIGQCQKLYLSTDSISMDHSQVSRISELVVHADIELT